MLRERLAFLVFEAMGIAAPRNAFARLTVNGEYWGLFALVEPVSKPFLESAPGREERHALRLRVGLPLRLLLARARARGLRAAAVPARDEREQGGRGGRARGLHRGDQLHARRDVPPRDGVLARRRPLLDPRGDRERARGGRRRRRRAGPQQLLPLRVRGEEAVRVHPLGQGQHVPQRDLAAVLQPREEPPHPRPDSPIPRSGRCTPTRSCAPSPPTSTPAGSRRSSSPPTSRSAWPRRPTPASPTRTRSSRRP